MTLCLCACVILKRAAGIIKTEWCPMARGKAQSSSETDKSLSKQYIVTRWWLWIYSRVRLPRTPIGGTNTFKRVQPRLGTHPLWKRFESIHVVKCLGALMDTHTYFESHKHTHAHEYAQAVACAHPLPHSSHMHAHTRTQKHMYANTYTHTDARII